MSKRQKIRTMVRALDGATDRDTRHWLARRILRQVGRIHVARKRLAALRSVPDVVFAEAEAVGA